MAGVEYVVAKLAGRISCVPAIATMFEYCDEAYVNTTLLPLEVAGLTNGGRPATLAAAFVFTRLNVAATSAAVNAEPSLHLTPERIVNVSVLPPLVHAYDFASHGYWTPAFKELNSISGSYTSEHTLICLQNELESTGLKLSVKVTPVLFSNVSVGLAPDADVTPADTTRPSIKHDVAVNRINPFLIIFILYI